jgi:hypothetical protein
MPSFPSSKLGLALSVLLSLTGIAGALTLDHEKQTHASLSSVTATLTGHSELHITGAGDPIPGSVIHLNSEDSWIFFHAVTPSSVVSNLLPRIRVNGAVAAVDANIRVVQHVAGAVVIPHPADYRPLEVFTGRHLGGASARLQTYTAYGNATLGAFAANIRSFRLKRGYTATFAANENGTGASRNFVAQDSDLELSFMPSGLDGTARFVRVFPWRWVSKKGSCDVSAGALNAKWHYNWNISLNSPRDWEYAAIKQQPWWPGLDQNWQTRGVNHLLGFNEPDNPVEHAYQNLSPQGSVSDAVARWDELLGTGLRVGAPAVTDGGSNWIVNFLNQANAAGKRVDYVPIHYYRSSAGNNPATAATAMYNFLKSIHDVAQRPIWVTEFNNGANWTNDAHDPTVEQNRAVVQAMIQMMDSTPWIERYAIYSRVEWFRQTHYDSGGITPMGAMYRDHVAPMAYQQAVPNTGSSGNAAYLFDGHPRDVLSGNNPLIYGTPKRVPGKHGEALSFDGTDDHLVLPGRLGDSNDFSFAGWVRWNGGANWQRIFDLGNGTASNLFLTPRSGGNTLRFAIKLNNGTEQQLNAPPLATGVWTHVAVTIGGNTGKLFVNGALVNTNASMTINPSQIGTETNYLGKSQWPDPLFNGSLDDLRFFNSALTDAQVSALASSTAAEFVASPSVGTATVDLPFTADLASLLVSAPAGVVFEKTSGPAWLAVSADGSLFGVPGLADAGPGTLLVRATAPGGAISTASLPIPVEAADHVARYPFDSTPLAAVGKAHVTLAGGVGYIAGQSGQALLLDGTDDHALLPAGVASGDEITVAGWVFWNGGGQWQRIFDFGSGTGSYLFLSPRSGGNTLRFGIRHGGTEQFVETTQLASGVWTHLAVTLDASGGRIFVNGTPAATNAAMTLKPSDLLPTTHYIGRSQFAADPYFSGRIDELHIFHRALGTAEINALRTGIAPTPTANPLVLSPPAVPGEGYEANVAGKVAAAVTFSKVAGPAWLTVEPDGRISGVPGDSDSGNPPFRVRAASTTSPVLAADFTLHVPVLPPAGLRAHYEFDGAVSDSAGVSHATSHGSPGFVAGIFDRAVDLDGSDDHVQLPAGIVSDLTDATFAVRFRWDGGGAWQRVFDFGNNTTQYLFLTPNSASGTLRFGITTGGSASQQFIDAPPPPVGEWTHVAVVMEGNTATLFVNGTTATSGTITIDPAQVAPALNYLGRSQWPDPYFNGAIDDFRIFDHALDAADVKRLAVPPPPVVVPPASGYAAWSSALPFPEGKDAPDEDADGDGLANVIEWLFGSDPLDGASGATPPAESFEAAEIGLADGKTYLGFRARVLKNRPGVTLIPEAAATPADFGTPAAAASAVQAGPPVDDGDFEIFTWHHGVAIEDAETGFMRLRVMYE